VDRGLGFSGGNQQKIAIAKWLLAESRCLLLYDPTRAFDVGTRTSSTGLIRAFADAGGCRAVLSTAPRSLRSCISPIAPWSFYAGRVAAEIAGAELSEEAILEAALVFARAGRAAA